MPDLNLDPYSRRARVFPMFIVLSPLATVVGAWTPGVLSLVTGLGGLAVTGVASFFLAQIARNAGKRREESLWRSWGGAPTVRKLRHRDKTFNRHLRARCHALLNELGEPCPTAEEESGDPRAADERYVSCTKLLISRTRDSQHFGLVFKENINYGFWRNLWALKPVGLSLALLSLALCAARLWLSWEASGSIPEPPLIGGSIDVGLILCWIFWISPEAVRVPADAYADRLIEACLELAREKGK